MSTTHDSTTFTYEQLMASFRESREELKVMREQMRETREQIARLGDRLGQLVAAMVEGGIVRMFKDLGYEFDVYTPRQRFGNKALNIYGEVDLFLENGDIALLVEVKTNLSIDDVKEHQERLENFRLVADVKNDKRQFIAAVVGGVIQKNVRDFALKQGMFVVQQSGENVEIIAPEGPPTAW